MLGLEAPWSEIATHLDRDEAELVDCIKKAFNRRNNIVHLGDWDSVELAGQRQDINYQWTEQSVLTIRSVCETLDELVAKRVDELKAMREPQETAVRNEYATDPGIYALGSWDPDERDQRTAATGVRPQTGRQVSTSG